ncbi:hypothetical protein FB451DRAFT_1360623 [Mycena latifolia]|nr:hypothetical protein FB451DRAFT_1360623 [Mycena latifolia]
MLDSKWPTRWGGQLKTLSHARSVCKRAPHLHLIGFWPTLSTGQGHHRVGFEKLRPDGEEMDDEVQGTGGTCIGFKRGQREGHVASSPSIAKEEGQQVRGRGRRGKGMNNIPWLSLAHPSFDWVLAIGLHMGRMAQWGIWGCTGVRETWWWEGYREDGDSEERRWHRDCGGRKRRDGGNVTTDAAHQFHCPLIKATKWQVATISSLLAPDLHLHRHHSLLTPPRPPPLASDCVSEVDFDLASAPRGVVLTNVSSKYVVKSRKIQRGVPQLKSAGRPNLSSRHNLKYSAIMLV